MKILFIIINWNNPSATIKCLNSINQIEETSSRVSFSVTIVDNNSIKPFKDKLHEFIKFSSIPFPLNIINSKSNIGYGGAINLAIEENKPLNFSHYWILNNDVELLPNSYIAMTSYLKQNEKKIIGCVALESDRRTVACYGGAKYNRWLGYDKPLYKGKSVESLTDVATQDLKFDYIQGACFVLNSDFIHEIGGFSDRYFLYFEELDIAKYCRLIDMGICSKAFVVHEEQGMSKLNKHLSEFCSYHASLSCFRYTRLYYPKMLPTVVLARLIAKSAYALRTGSWMSICGIFKALTLVDKHNSQLK